LGRGKKEGAQNVGVKQAGKRDPRKNSRGANLDAWGETKRDKERNIRKGDWEGRRALWSLKSCLAEMVVIVGIETYINLGLKAASHKGQKPI